MTGAIAAAGAHQNQGISLDPSAGSTRQLTDVVIVDDDQQSSADGIQMLAASLSCNHQSIRYFSSISRSKPRNSWRFAPPASTVGPKAD
jgi:hypothetical protein